MIVHVGDRYSQTTTLVLSLLAWNLEDFVVPVLKVLKNLIFLYYE